MKWVVLSLVGLLVLSAIGILYTDKISTEVKYYRLLCRIQEKQAYDISSDCDWRDLEFLKHAYKSAELGRE